MKLLCWRITARLRRPLQQVPDSVVTGTFQENADSLTFEQRTLSDPPPVYPAKKGVPVCKNYESAFISLF